MSDYLGIEVKGLFEKFGSITLTSKEYEAACALKNRFYIFVVKNFKDIPFYELYQNPLDGELSFKKSERQVIQVSWTTII